MRRWAPIARLLLGSSIRCTPCARSRAGYPVVGVYDCGKSGAIADLAAEATFAIRDFSGLSFERLAENADRENGPAFV